MPSIPCTHSPAADLHRTGSGHVALSAEFAERFARTSRERDLHRISPQEEIRALAASGLLAARVPVEYGGAGASIADFARIIINLARGDANIAQAAAPSFPNIEKIRIYGSEAQRRHYFGLAVDGALLTGNAAAEKAGLHLGDYSTKLIPDDDGYILVGDKSYTTGSLYAEFTLVTAVTDTGGRAAAMIPTDRAGVTIADDWDGMGQRTTASGSARFDRVRVDPSEVLHIPDYGRRRTYEGSFAQVLHSALDTGIAWAAIDDGLQQSRTSSRPLPEAGVQRGTDDPYVLHAAGEMVILARGAELLTLRGAAKADEAAAAFFDGSADADRLLAEASVAVAEAKFASTEASLKVGEMVYRLGGASATLRRINLDRHWRNARTHTTHDPVAYKARAVGDFFLNGTYPPINTKI